MNEGRSNGSTKAHHPERDWTPDRRAKVATVEGKKVGEKLRKVSELSQILVFFRKSLPRNTKGFVFNSRLRYATPDESQGRQIYTVFLAKEIRPED